MTGVLVCKNCKARFHRGQAERTGQGGVICPVCGIAPPILHHSTHDAMSDEEITRLRREQEGAEGPRTEDLGSRRLRQERACCISPSQVAEIVRDKQPIGHKALMRELKRCYPRVSWRKTAAAIREAVGQDLIRKTQPPSGGTQYTTR